MRGNDVDAIDDLLIQAHGETLGRLIAGSYRLAATAAALKAQLDAAAPKADSDSEEATS